MKKILVATLGALLLASPVLANVGAIKVCDSKTLATGTTTDCDIVELPANRYLSYQIYCGETTGNNMTIHVDWVNGSSKTALAVPVGVGQLKTSYTTEDAWSAVAPINTPIATYGTLRFTEAGSDADIVCSAILNVGDEASDESAAYTVSAAITADSGSAQGGSPLVSDINIITVCGTAGDSVTLPVAQAGLVVTIINATATSADIFPAADGAINAVAHDGAYALATLRTAVCYGLDALHWQCTYSVR